VEPQTKYVMLIQLTVEPHFMYDILFFYYEVDQFENYVYFFMLSDF